MFTRFFRRLMRLKLRPPNIRAIVGTFIQAVTHFFTQTGLSKIIALIAFVLFNWATAFVYYAILSVFRPKKAKEQLNLIRQRQGEKY